MITSTIPQASISDSSPFSNKRKIDKLYLIFSFIWGYSLVGACNTSLSSKKISSAALTVGFLAANWVIFPFKPQDGFNHPDMKKEEKACRVAAYTLGILAGFFTSLLLNVYAYDLRERENYYSSLLFTEEFKALYLNLLASYLLWQRPTFNEKIKSCALAKKTSQWLIGKGKCLFQNFSNLTTPAAQESLGQGFSKVDLGEIEALRAENREMARTFHYLKSLIESHPKLRLALQSSFTILSFPKMDDHEQLVEDLLVEEWRVEMQTRVYWINVKNYIKEFLESNPDFYEKLKSVLAEEEEGSEKAREAFQFLNELC